MHRVLRPLSVAGAVAAALLAADWVAAETSGAQPPGPIQVAEKTSGKKAAKGQQAPESQKAAEQKAATPEKPAAPTAAPTPAAAASPKSAAPVAAAAVAGAAAATAVAAVASTASAGPSPDPAAVLRALIESSGSPYLGQSQQNLMMMPDNPALWTVEEGKDLFHTPRGPNNVSLEGCDFGKGPGVIKGAYVELPRYFADTGKVMDLETRLVHCMISLQGFAPDSPNVKKRDGFDSDQMRLQSYIAAQSNGMPWKMPLDHPLEKAMRNAGEVLFFRRAGPFDFNCAACHGEPGKRIRASVLPYAASAVEWTKAISWPAYRVGQDNPRSSQHRLRECIWQMRYPAVVGGSDASIALISFWTDLARGQPAILPDMKR